MSKKKKKDAYIDGVVVLWPDIHPVTLGHWLRLKGHILFQLNSDSLSFSLGFLEASEG